MGTTRGWPRYKIRFVSKLIPSRHFRWQRLAPFSPGTLSRPTIETSSGRRPIPDGLCSSFKCHCHQQRPPPCTGAASAGASDGQTQLVPSAKRWAFPRTQMLSRVRGPTRVGHGGESEREKPLIMLLFAPLLFSYLNSCHFSLTSFSLSLSLALPLPLTKTSSSISRRCSAAARALQVQLPEQRLLH